MKKNKLALQSSSGIHINYCEPANLKPNKKINTLNILAQYLIIMICALGSIFTFTTMMDVKCNSLVLIILMAICTAVYMFAFNKCLKPGLILGAATLLCLLIGLLFFSVTAKGYVIIYDDARTAIAAAMYWSPPEITYAGGDLLTFNTTLVLGLVTVLLCYGLTYFTVIRSHFLGLFLLTFPFFEVGAAYGCVPNHYCFSLMIASWAAALALHMANRTKVKIKSRRGKNVVKQYQFTEKKRSGKFVISAAAIALATFLLFSICQAFLISSGYSRGGKINGLRVNIKNFYSNVFDLATGVDNDGSLKEGKLYKLADLKVKNRRYMTITMPDSANSLYLKGYVGSTYTGRSWEDLDSYDNYKTLFSGFEKMGVYPAEFIGELLNSSDTNFLLSSGDFSISNLRRKKDYAFLIYGAKLDNSYSQLNDKYASPSKKSTYKYTAYFDKDDIFRVNKLLLYNDTNFSSLWSRYSEFVNENYTTLPDDGLDAVISVAKSLPEGTIYDKVDYVRDFLNSSTEFSLYSRTLPSDEDFVDYFLFNQQHGYSAHYATAAAVMLRALGVPTRYVEGYLLTSEKINAAAKVGAGTYKSLDVTDADAHAWIEIYDNTYGWIPAEVTPGFYDESFADYVQKAINNAQNNQEQEKPKEEDDKDLKGDKDNKSNTPDIETDLGPTFETGESVGFFTPDRVMAALKVLIETILVLLLILMLFIGRRVYAVTKRNKRLNSKDLNEKIYAYYEYFIKLIRYEGIRLKDFYSYREFENYIRKNAEFLPNDKLQEVMNVFLKAGFSNEAINENEAEIVENYVKLYCDDITDCIEWYKRFKLKYIYNLK